MLQRGGSFAHIVLRLAALTILASCAEETQSSSYELPLRLSPLRLQGASDADSAAAWALFDRDTATRWAPAGGELAITLDAPRTLAYLKVFGPASGTIEIRTDSGGVVLPALNLAGLRDGWNRVTLSPGDAVDRLTLRVTGGSSVPDLELWALDAPRPLLDTERLLEQIAYGKLDGQADVVSTQPGKITLAANGLETCGDFLFELSRDPSVYRRAWIAYGATGLFRPFVVTRSINDGPRSRAQWLREDTAVGVFVEPIDPERLTAGLNWFQVCLPTEAGGSLVLQDARFIGELDNGSNMLEGAAIGTAGAKPTRPASFLLDPMNAETQDVSSNERILVAFERWISPDTVLLATDRREEDAWRVECLDAAGAGVRLATERTLDDTRGVALVVQGSGDALCAGLSLQPSKAARVSFVTVAGSGARARVDWTRIVLASPLEHFGRVAWVEGWASAPGGVDAILSIDSIDAGSAGVFGELLKRPGNRDDAWPVTVTARLADGTSTTSYFVLGRYADPTGIVESALGDRGTQLSPEESADRYGETGETVEQAVDPDADTSIRLGTHVGVDIPAGAVNGNGLVVSITHLDASAVPRLDPGIINVTAPVDHGYEFLPHGQEFKEAATVLLPFDPALVPPGYSTDDVHAYYFDEDAQRWRRLSRSQVNETDGTTQSLTDHFTVMINAIVVAPEHPQVSSFNPNEISGIRSADPGAGTVSLDPPTPNETGATTLRYPISVPPGRAGLHPSLAFSYDSTGGNGWLGVGWNLSFPAISIDTRFGAPRFDPTSETETYTLDGAQLTPIAHRGPPRARADGTTVIDGETVKVFHTRVEGDFARIVRHGTHPTNYWWEVVDKKGMRYFYGGDPDSGGPAADSTLVSAGGDVFLWALREVRDPHGNFARYCAERVSDVGMAAGTVPGWELYLSSIDYTRDPGSPRSCHPDDQGPYRVKFRRDSHVGASRRPDVIIDGRGRFKRVTAERLRRVEVYFRDTLVRAYDLDYTIGAFHKSLLREIRQFGVGNSPFPGQAHTFEYYDDVRTNPMNPAFYAGFASENDWAVADDDIDSGLIVPGAVHGIFGPDEPSLLGGGTSHSGTGHIYIGFNPFSPSKQNSFGGKVGFGVTSGEGVAALVDVDGDSLSDKVFRTGSGFRFRRNESGPDNDYSFSSDTFALPGLPDALSEDFGINFSFGVEAYPLVFGLIFNHNESFTRTSTYLSDVNGDGLIDIVDGGQVRFNRRTVSGGQEFVFTSTGTPFPIIPGSVDTSGLLPDYSDVLDAANAANPLVDSVRFWVAPFSGTVDVTGTVNRTRSGPDGIRVAIQKNDDELWHEEIAGNDLAVKTPTGVSGISVFPGDRIYFRVNSRENGQDDEVAWNPAVAYTMSSILDANELDVTRYGASADFILGGRPGISAVAPFEGTVRMQGTLQKLRSTSDNVAVQIRQNGTTVFSSSLNWDAVTDIAIDHSFSVDREDNIELLVLSDSQVDLTALAFNPVVLLTYTSAVDGDGNPVAVNDPSGDPIFKIHVPYDMSIYGVRIPAGTPSPWVAPGDPGDTYTLPIKVTATLPVFFSEQLTFTTKESGDLLAKHTFFPNGGVPQVFSFNLPVEALHSYFFEFHTPNRVDGFGSSTSVVIDLGFIEIPLPRATYTVTEPDLCSRPYRGWAYAGYVPDQDDLDDPIRHSGAEAFCTVDTDFDEDTDLPDNRGDLEDGADNLDDSVTRAFAPYPGGRNCQTNPVSCQIPAGALWGGPSELQYITGTLMSSSRQGSPEVAVPGSDQIAGAGASAVARLSRTSENAGSVSGGVGPISANFSVSVGTSTGEVDFLDMNGDRFPDVVSHSGVQFTDPRGTLAERRPILSGVRESDSVAFNAGIGGSVARSQGNGKGRFGPTGTSGGTNAENDSQMAELGFAISANGNIMTHDVQEELMDVNGDGLPDRLSIDGGRLWVQLNTGYEFLPIKEEWDGGTTINTGNGAQLGGGASFSFNDGIYGFGGGINVSTGVGRINEWIGGFQRDGQTLADVNGDGLVDRVVADGGTLTVRFNTGHGFGGASQYQGLLDRDVTENKTSTIGAGAYFTISIGPLCIAACYLIINPGGDVNESLNRPETVLTDVNGDTYADHLESNEDGELAVALNNHGRTNLIRKVQRPMNSWFEVDYERKGNTFEDPSSHWVLSRVTLFDGLAGDGADYRFNSFTYGPGVYDRFEREFYGFAEVVETDHDTTGVAPGSLASSPAYRRIRREYHNDSFFMRGKIERSTTTGVAGVTEPVFTVTESAYLLREVDTGVENPDPDVFRLSLSSVFPMLQSETKRVSEGDATIALETQGIMTYDQFGNVVAYTDSGDGGAGDDYTATITYTGAAGRHAACAAGHLVGHADSITVSDSVGRILRHRIADYDCATGDLLHLEQTLDTSGGVAASDYAYDSLGNLVTAENPANYRGQRYTLRYTYDDDIRTHVKTASDSFGLTSEALYDLRFGEPSSTTDANGNTITKTYDDFGRMATVTGPYEQGTGHTTITFEYHPEAPVPYARTRNLDSYRDLADPIETIVFTDGVRRVVQTKKDVTVHTGRSSDPDHVMVVSGRLTYDHVGRTIQNFYPTVEAKNDAINTTFSAAYDSVAPTEMVHDFLNRVTLTTYPDGSTLSQFHDLAADRHGVRRAAVTTTDALGNRKTVYSDVRESQMSIQEFNDSDGEVIWTEYVYDPLQQLLEIIDDHGNRTTAGYDLIGRRTHLDNPDSGRIETVYDAADNVTEKVTGHVRAAGAAVTYEYDHTRRIAIHYPLFPENDVAYEYGDALLRGHGGNRVGRITRVTDESGVEDRLYGKLGELTQETKTVASDTLGACAGCPEVWTTQYVHDTWGRLQQLTYPDTEVLTYSYDSGGLVRAVKGDKLGIEYPYVERLEYDKFEKRQFLAYGNGVETVYDWHPVERTLSRQEAGAFQNLHYEYDDVGNVTSLLNDVPPGHPNEMGGRVEQNFEYDSLYRLTHASGTFRYGPQKEDKYNLAFDYDTIHNVLTKTQAHTVQTKNNKPIPQHKTSYDWAYAYESDQPHAPSRIFGDAHPGLEDRAFFYDDSGNQLGWDDLTSGRRRTIVWDEENRMQSIADNGRTTTFKYDDAGQRVIKRGAQGETAYVNQYWTIRNRTVGTKHVFVGDSRMASKLSPGTAHSNPGDLWGDMVKNWYNNHVGLFPGRAVGFTKKHLPDDNFIYWYHSDHLGSTGWITNPDGELYEHQEYFPTGESWVAEDSNTERMPYLFSGKEVDQETGLYYFGARYYDPQTSVWQSTDPILGDYFPVANRAQEADLPGMGGVFNPPNLAMYTFNYQNPLKFLDPDGQAPNQAGACNPSVIVAELRAYEAAGMTHTQALDALSAAHGGNTNRYFYTDRYGWVDVRHFGAAASYGNDYGNVVTETLGFGNEVRQWLSEWGNDYRSGFSPEDIPSNAAGARFGDSLSSSGSLTTQFEAWLKSVGGRDTSDPKAGFSSLPAADPSVRGGGGRGSSNSSSEGPGAAHSSGASTASSSSAQPAGQNTSSSSSAPAPTATRPANTSSSSSSAPPPQKPPPSSSSSSQ